MVDPRTSGALRNEMRRIVLNRICEKMDGVALENPLKKNESQRIIAQDAKAFALKFAEENVPQDDEQEIGILRKSAAILRRHVLKFRQKHQSKPENFKVSFDNIQQDYPAELALFLEGETAIILGLTAMNIEHKQVPVYANDSDLFALLLMHYSSFNSHELHMKSLTGYTSITAINEFLGPDVAKALLSFHALNGCDTTGKFSGEIQGILDQKVCPGKKHCQFYWSVECIAEHRTIWRCRQQARKLYMSRLLYQSHY